MFELDTTDKKIQVVLKSAKTTNDLEFVAAWSELPIDLSTASLGDTDGTTNGVTAVTMVDSPADGFSRQVKHLSVFNADTVAQVVCIQYVSSGGTRNLVNTRLSVGETLVYDDHAGWQTLLTSGGLKGGGAISVDGSTIIVNDAGQLAIKDPIVINDTVTGTIDGSNTSFALNNPPIAGSLLLSVNGLCMLEGLDYTIAGSTITFGADSIPQSGDWIRATYQT